MATNKQKKKSPQVSVPKKPEQTAALQEKTAQASPTAIGMHAIDNEPKVSFTLEFYVLDDKENSFIGRVKKIGSEEQATLIEDLSDQAWLDFIQRNLPKSWVKPRLPKSIAAPEKAISIAPVLGQVEEDEHDLETKPSANLFHDRFERGKLEIWQSGQKRTMVDANQVFSLCFEADAPQQWLQYQAHFKSWETDIPSYQVSQKKTSNGAIHLEMAPGTLQPGLYLLEFNARALTPTKAETIFRATQLIQFT